MDEPLLSDGKVAQVCNLCGSEQGWDRLSNTGLETGKDWQENGFDEGFAVVQPSLSDG